MYESLGEMCAGQATDLLQKLTRSCDALACFGIVQKPLAEYQAPDRNRCLPLAEKLKERVCKTSH